MSNGALSNEKTEEKNPSPLIYNKHKVNCTFEGDTTKNENEKAKICTVSVIYVDPDGYIKNANFIQSSVAGLGKGVMNKINGIVLHRTDSSSVEGTLTSFSKGVGTHFLIAKNGDIHQTVSLFSYTYHVGKIKSRCMEEKTCSAEESKKIKSFGWNPGKVYDHEKVKMYPERYPYNGDSVGIEVVAMHKNDGWESPTLEQTNSISKLVDIIKNIYELDDRDVYEHDKISYKMEGEGAGLYVSN
ncbi:peptidoglycan recognition protein family protein [Budvicia diplopodorum]|uniref:peptidoglycan recognition protein family protein n=1 Tax=Budvicia diplopodorum TaxID=1119056 RepID=UPI00135CA73B|nr:N-acetylmuramoyl-L-alanine amidase [Budvicia diplopodorum]